MSLVDKRKRSREDDLCCESTPLSKRINNLHLTNFEEKHQHHHHHINNNDIHISRMEELHKVEQLPQLPLEDVDHEMEYNPDLNEAQNPFYYMKNKLLHELHMERLKRCIL